MYFFTSVNEINAYNNAAANCQDPCSHIQRMTVNVQCNEQTGAVTGSMPGGTASCSSDRNRVFLHVNGWDADVTINLH